MVVLRTTKSSNEKQTPVHERFSNLSLCHGCCIPIREIQGVEKWTLLLDGRHCKNTLQRQMDRGTEKCVTNFISTMESNKGTIRELRGHQRNKTDGKETSRNILGCPMVRPHRSISPGPRWQAPHVTSPGQCPLPDPLSPSAHSRPAFRNSRMN